MDQLAELLGTIAFGWCITHHSHLIVLPLISAVALVGLPLEVWAIHQVYVPSVCQALHSMLPSESLHMYVQIKAVYLLDLHSRCHAAAVFALHSCSCRAKQ